MRRPSAYVSRCSVKLRRNASWCFSSAARSPSGPLISIPSYNVPLGSTGMPASLIRYLPVTSKFSSARPSGSITRWHEVRSEEHTSELQSQSNLVCRLLLEKKKQRQSPEQPYQ